ncbi:MAG: hypothetical protein LBB52_03460, partial [Desulfovibrio sp.]|nr:hypothetical protein [Desulfovibrio sp.]
ILQSIRAGKNRLTPDNVDKQISLLKERAAACDLRAVNDYIRKKLRQTEAGGDRAKQVCRWPGWSGKALAAKSDLRQFFCRAKGRPRNPAEKCDFRQTYAATRRIGLAGDGYRFLQKSVRNR